MFGSAVLETAIGAIFVFLLVSLIGSGIGNWISELFKLRANHLESSIRNLLLNGDSQLLGKLYASPLIKSLAPPGKKPIDIPAQTFILALFDAFVPGASGKTTVQDIHDEIATALADDSPFKKPLLAFFNKAEMKIDDARANAENWFNGAEEWMTKTYRDKIMVITFLVSLGVAVVFNVDAVAAVWGLWRDPTLRSSVAAAATQYAQQAAQSTNDQIKQSNAQQAIEELNKLELPFGWQIKTTPSFSLLPLDWAQGARSIAFGDFLLKLLGWIITGLAGSQGAPFWFDLLKRLTQKD